MNAGELFRDALEWLQCHYTDFHFFVERDMVWTLQLKISEEIEQLDLPYRLFNDHTVSKGIRADLAILDGDSVEVVAEFKYEPSHTRRANWGGDIWPSKFPVVDWKEVGKDVLRVQDYVQKRSVREAYSIFIDEGSDFSWRDPHPGSKWIDWGQGVSVLWSHSRLS